MKRKVKRLVFENSTRTLFQIFWKISEVGRNVLARTADELIEIHPMKSCYCYTEIKTEDERYLASIYSQRKGESLFDKAVTKKFTS